jgi:hypothetical protein
MFGKMSTQEVADHYGCSPKTVCRWITDGHLEAGRPYPTGPFYIDESELYRFDPGSVCSGAGLGHSAGQPVASEKSRGVKSGLLKPWRRVLKAGGKNNA